MWLARRKSHSLFETVFHNRLLVLVLGTHTQTRTHTFRLPHSLRKTRCQWTSDTRHRNQRAETPDASSPPSDYMAVGGMPLRRADGSGSKRRRRPRVLIPYDFQRATPKKRRHCPEEHLELRCPRCVGLPLSALNESCTFFEQVEKPPRLHCIHGPLGDGMRSQRCPTRLIGNLALGILEAA